MRSGSASNDRTRVASGARCAPVPARSTTIRCSRSTCPAWSHRGVERLHTPRIRGHSLFVSRQRRRKRPSSLRFARLLGAELRQRCLAPTLHHAEPVAGESRELIDRALGVYRFDDLAVLRTATMPAVLFEAGVIVNRGEEARLQQPAHRRLLAGALTRAAIAFCDGRAPKRVAETRCR